MLCGNHLKTITQTVVIYFNQATKAEDRIVAMILCLVRSTCYLSPRVRNTCTEIWELSGFYYSHFVRWITALHSFFYKNMFYKNIQAEICEILRIF